MLLPPYGCLRLGCLYVSLNLILIFLLLFFSAAAIHCRRCSEEARNTFISLQKLAQLSTLHDLLTNHLTLI